MPVQDEALDFYVGKLGFELNTDADLGFMRWLTVNFPGQPDHQLLLEKPGAPAHDDATAEQIRELVTKGAMGMAAIIAVDDVHKTYEELVAKGVEFTDHRPGHAANRRDRAPARSRGHGREQALLHIPAPMLVLASPRVGAVRQRVDGDDLRQGSGQATRG